MAINNKSVTLLGSTVKLVSYTIYPQPDGSFRATIQGTVSDGAGVVDAIETRATYPSGTAVLDTTSAAALTRLRQDNGFES